MQSEAEYLTPADLAERFRIPLKTVREHVYNRRIPGALKVGGSWRFRRQAIEKAIASGQLLLPARK